MNNATGTPERSGIQEINELRSKAVAFGASGRTHNIGKTLDFTLLSMRSENQAALTLIRIFVTTLTAHESDFSNSKG